jgi:ATP-dependent Clp protease ATP-binding subunit ClpA
MFERFTTKARQVVVGAQEEARELLHNYIGTEHLLLGLLSVPDSVGAKALRELNLGRATVRSEVLKIVGAGKETSSGHIPFTPRAKKCLELALREALHLRHNYIGTEHILLALVKEGEGVAAQIMSAHVDDLRTVRATVLALVKAEPELPPEAGEPAKRQRKSTAAAEDVVSAAEALAGAAPIGSHHLLEALIRAEGSMAARVFDALGVDAEVVAAKIDELDPETTTDATPEEAAARKMELRLEGDEVQLVFRDQETVDLARQVTALTGGSVVGNGPISGAFVPLWTSTNQLLLSFLRTLQPEPEDETKDVTKVVTMMRRVMRGRLQRRPDIASPDS